MFTESGKVLARARAVLAIAVLALLAASTSVAQSTSAIVADIPFAFTVANHTLPPGHYTVTRVSETTLRIFNTYNQGTVVLTSSAEGNAPKSTSKMVFHH